MKCHTFSGLCKSGFICFTHYQLSSNACISKSLNLNEPFLSDSFCHTIQLEVLIYERPKDECTQNSADPKATVHIKRKERGNFLNKNEL